MNFNRILANRLSDLIVQSSHIKALKALYLGHKIYVCMLPLKTITIRQYRP